MMRYQSGVGLTDDAAGIRRAVFMEEQGFVNEFDDADAVSTHIVLYDDDVPAATCRLSFDGDVCTIGRIAVMPEYRGRSLGKGIVAEAERLASESGCRSMRLSAQVRVRGFYESMGYSAHGDEYLDEWCPHVSMSKDL